MARFYSELNWAKVNLEATKPPRKKKKREFSILTHSQLHKQRLTPHQLALLFVVRPERLQTWQREYLAQLGELDGTIAITYKLVQEFATLMRQRQGAKLEQWLKQVELVGVTPLQKFAGGLKTDYGAVVAGMSLE